MKNLKKYMGLLPALVMCLSLVACGSSGGEWSDANVIDDYDTVTRNGKQIDVCVCHDQEAVYLYYNNEEHELFDTAMLPTDKIYDEDWLIGVVDFSDFTGDNNGDLQVYISHADMSESYIVWTWEKDKGYVYQPDDSRFYEPRVIYDPNDDTASDYYSWNPELYQRNVSEFEGTWYYDEDPSADTYIIIDGNGNWSYCQCASGETEGTEMDYGTFSYSSDEGCTYYADSAMYDGLSIRVLEFDEGILIWGDEGAYYRMDD